MCARLNILLSGEKNTKLNVALAIQSINIINTRPENVCTHINLTPFPPPTCVRRWLVEVYIIIMLICCMRILIYHYTYHTYVGGKENSV